MKRKGDTIGREVQLAMAICRGNETALAEFCKRYTAPLRAFIYRRLGGGGYGEYGKYGGCGGCSDVEEVLQDTLLAAVRAINSFRGDSALFSWLCGIARHKAADFSRRHQDDPVPFAALPPETLAEMMDEGPLPEEIIEQGAVQALVIEALWSLPKDYRAALIARYVEGLDVKDVASMLGRSYKAAESVLSRARAAFKKTFAKLEE